MSSVFHRTSIHLGDGEAVPIEVACRMSTGWLTLRIDRGQAVDLYLTAAQMRIVANQLVSVANALDLGGCPGEEVA